MEDGNANDEVSRLRAIGAWMREVGAVELSLGDLRIRMSAQAPAPAGNGRQVDPDEQEELTAEERELANKSAEERAHFKFWKRVTRSSGAPIPPFRGPTQ